MSAHEVSDSDYQVPFFTKGTMIVAAIAGLGILAYIYRLIYRNWRGNKPG